MPGNSFGKIFTVTTFGESHGAALGAIVDGCPPGMELSEQDIQPDLAGFTFEKSQQIADLDAAHLAVQQVLHRQPLTTVIGRQHDLVDTVLFDEFDQRLLVHHALLVRTLLLAVAGHRHVTNHIEPAEFTAGLGLAHQPGRFPGTEHQHPDTQVVGPGDAHEHQSHPHDEHEADQDGQRQRASAEEEHGRDVVDDTQHGETGR